MGNVVFAVYKPHAGKEKELEKLIQQHVPVLRELELVTDRPSLTFKSKDGTYVELIEWRDSESAGTAHEHPAVARIWEAMGSVADFKKLADLPEAGTGFPHFETVAHLCD